MLHKCICMLQMPKLVPLGWAAVHQVMSSHEMLMSTNPDAWRALGGVWSAMSAHCAPDELLSHTEQLALALSSKAALPGWTKLDFPVGLVMSMALLSIRYTNQASTVCLKNQTTVVDQVVLLCVLQDRLQPDHAIVKAVARSRSSCCCMRLSQWHNLCIATRSTIYSKKLLSWLQQPLCQQVWQNDKKESSSDPAAG